MLMHARRGFLKQLGISAAASIVLGGARLVSGGEPRNGYMPDESEPHTRTWMAFGASKSIWGTELLPKVQQDLATIALSIAQYEPVTMLVRSVDLKTAQRLMGKQVEFMVCPLDDLWIRDTGPVFVLGEGGQKQAINFNFNGWGGKQRFINDSQVAEFVANRAGAVIVRSNLTLEGGGIEVDGHGTAIITESCVLNSNRNPGVSKAQCEHELKRLLGLKKIIWLPGIKNRDITDGHTDFYARFAKPGTVVAAYDADPTSFDHAVTKRHLEILRAATDARGKPLNVVVLEAPKQLRSPMVNDDFAAGYVNFYLCNGAVIVPEFGDRDADARAREALAQLFPERDIVQLNIDGIAAGGGDIHCATQQEPAVLKQEM